MKTRTLTVALATFLVTPAFAQEKPESETMETPTRAFEIFGAAGYTQGFGNLHSGLDMQKVITPGVATDVGLGYRIDPHWSVSLFGQYAEFSAERATSARGLVVGANGTYHFIPMQKWDPFVQLGAGYRFLWEKDITPGTTLLTDGFELGRLTIGFDYRASRDIAFSTFAGLDLTLPLWQSAGTTMAISDPRLSTFIFAGMGARFDLTSNYVGGPKPVATAQLTQATTCVTPPIVVSDEVKAACKLSADDAVLEKVAACFSTGPLAGTGMLLVGRADAVAKFMADHGVDRARIDRLAGGDDMLEIEIRIRR